ncbi:MAG TPA: hypothetical protein VFS83_04205 [Ktedonobacterales bacterium]|nr:hypothetical protein [Ktedonobacterales bacterium]
MGIHDPEQGDDLQIEVSSLQPSSATSEPSAELATGQSLFAPRQSHLAQRRRGIIVTCVLVATLVALTLTIAPTREALLGAVLGPTPTATAPVRAGEDNLYIALVPQWGAVTLDGRTLSHLPVEGIDQPFHLARGVHTIRWRFPPIIDIACRLTVPTALGDTCPLQVGILPGKKGIASVATLQLSLKTFAPAYRGSLLAAIQVALDSKQSNDLVRPGELYVGQYDPTSQRSVPLVATQPLRATLSFVSDVENPNAKCPAISSGPGEYCMMNGDCREICTAPWQTPPDTANGIWQAYIVAHASWHITTLDGHPIEQDPPDVGGVSNLLGNNEVPVPVTISWDGSNWHVDAMVGVRDSSSLLPDLVCASAWADVQNSFVAPPDPGGGQALTLTYIPGVPAASGCLLVMTVAGQPPLLVLHRFGVALAPDATTARRLCCPTLPLADAFEQQLAQRILATRQDR